jgi:hypothetical protein
MKNHYAWTHHHLATRLPKSSANINIFDIEVIGLVKSTHATISRRFKKHAHSTNPFRIKIIATLSITITILITEELSAQN